MANRLVHIVTEKLLSVQEAFGRMEPDQLSTLLLPIVEEELRKELELYCGGRGGSQLCVNLLHPFLPPLLTHIIRQLQVEIEDILDLRSVVLEAFVRDKIVLVELFQKVGRVELDFLVESGLGFGFLLGLVQMVAWVVKPKPWTLPVAGAVVGYVTNWIASEFLFIFFVHSLCPKLDSHFLCILSLNIRLHPLHTYTPLNATTNTILLSVKLLFDPAEPVMVGPIKVQGLFESRQVEVSEEFGRFMAGRVLNSRRILESLSKDGEDGELYSFLRRQLPYPVPEFIVSVAVRAMAKAADNPLDYPELHAYMTSSLDIEDTLSDRLKLLSPIEFEDLLHPVFQEDEILLIAAGGVLGALAGLGQTRLGWGGPGATLRSLITISIVSISSWGYFLFKEVIEQPEVVHVVEEKIVKRPVKLRRRNTLVQVQPEVIPDWLVIPEFR